jgi:hypothetical protein
MLGKCVSVQLGEEVAERIEEPQTAQISENQRRFASLGVGVGAVIPSVFVAIFALHDRSFLVGPHLLIGPEYWYEAGLALCLVGFGLAQVGINLPAGSGQTDRLMLLAGALSVLSLEAFVISTGGPILSVFSFYYLYIPVVVGITFPRRLTFWTGMVCWGMCIFALGLTWDPTTWRASAQQMGTELHSIVYAIIFTVQMFVTIAMIYLGQGDPGPIRVKSSQKSRARHE